MFWSAYNTDAFKEAEPDPKMAIEAYCVSAIVRTINGQLALMADEYLPAILDIFISLTFVSLATYAMIHTTVKQ